MVDECFFNTSDESIACAINSCITYETIHMFEHLQDPCTSIPSHPLILTFSLWEKELKSKTPPIPPLTLFAFMSVHSRFALEQQNHKNLFFLRLGAAQRGESLFSIPHYFLYLRKQKFRTIKIKFIDSSFQLLHFLLDGWMMEMLF